MVAGAIRGDHQVGWDHTGNLFSGSSAVDGDKLVHYPLVVLCDAVVRFVIIAMRQNSRWEMWGTGVYRAARCT